MAADDDAGWSRAHGGLDPHASRWVSGWLRLVRVLVRPLAGRGLSPDVVTLAGVVVSATVPLAARAGGGWLLLGAVAVLLAAVLDGVDGALAVADRSSSAWGRVLDQLADRCSDLLLLLALLLLGAPAWACVLLAIGTLLHESLRASAMAAGMRGVGAVTVWERPTRVILLVVVLLAAGAADLLDLPAWAPDGARLATGAAWVALALAAVGTTHLLVRVRQALAGLGGPDETGDDPRRERHER